MVAESSSKIRSVDGQWTRDNLVAGVLLVLLGLVVLVTPLLTGLVLSVLLGGALVVGALVHVAAAFKSRGVRAILWQAILGVVYGFAGIAVLANPMLGLASLTLLVIAFLTAEGVIQLLWAVSGRTGNSGVLAASGVVSLLLAGLLFAGFPTSALWAVGVLFGVNLLVTGTAMIVRARRQPEEIRTESQTGTGA